MIVRLDGWELNDWDGDFSLTCCKGAEGCSRGQPGTGGDPYAHVDAEDGTLVIEDSSGDSTVRVEIPIRVAEELIRRHRVPGATLKA